jgi:hypothetical protein
MLARAANIAGGRLNLRTPFWSMWGSSAKSSVPENDAIVDASRFLSIVGRELNNLSAT